MQPLPLNVSRLWVNGEPGGALSPLDRGLAYGDGLFETMRLAGSRIPLLDLHLRRVVRDCERLHIALDQERLRQEIAEFVSANSAGLESGGVVKLTVTRGVGGRGYRAPVDAASTRVLFASELPKQPREWWTDGVSVRFCEMRLGSNAALGGIKHLNRLEQVLARAEWDDPDVAEGLLTDQRGRVVEGTCTNLFVGSGGRLVTPVIDSCGVAGVMREYILEEAARSLAIPVSTAACERSMLGGAQELFLCNAVVGVWPVRRLAGRSLVAGPLTRKVQAHVAALFAD